MQSFGVKGHCAVSTAAPRSPLKAFYWLWTLSAVSAGASPALWITAYRGSQRERETKTVKLLALSETKIFKCAGR